MTRCGTGTEKVTCSPSRQKQRRVLHFGTEKWSRFLREEHPVPEWVHGPDTDTLAVIYNPHSSQSICFYLVAYDLYAVTY